MTKNEFVCDKTGTLTEGVFNVQKVVSKDYKEEDLLFYASAAEYYSNHPIALSLKEASQKEVDINKIKNTKEYAGKGGYIYTGFNRSCRYVGSSIC